MPAATAATDVGRARRRRRNRGRCSFHTRASPRSHRRRCRSSCPARCSWWGRRCCPRRRRWACRRRRSSRGWCSCRTTASHRSHRRWCRSPCPARCTWWGARGTPQTLGVPPPPHVSGRCSYRTTVSRRSRRRSCRSSSLRTARRGGAGADPADVGGAAAAAALLAGAAPALEGRAAAVADRAAVLALGGAGGGGAGRSRRRWGCHLRHRSPSRCSCRTAGWCRSRRSPSRSSCPGWRKRSACRHFPRTAASSGIADLPDAPPDQHAQIPSDHPNPALQSLLVIRTSPPPRVSEPHR